MAKTTTTNIVTDFKALLEKAHKLSEGERLPMVERKYQAVTDTKNLTVSVTLELPLSEVMKSAKGSNYIIPMGNVKGARGSNVIEAHTEDGLIIKLYADRAYISSEAQEKEKAVKNATNSEKELLKEQNKMLIALLAKNGIEL
jgi:hypothetical protein|nr:MAG TPA: hypothetical protein [Caudoviricetes sp.]